MRFRQAFRRRPPAPILDLVSWGAALALALGLFVHVWSDQRANIAPDHFTAATDLTPWTLAAADLPAGWRVLGSWANNRIVGQDGVRAAWVVVARTPIDGTFAREEVIVLGSTKQANAWIDQARNQTALRDQECQYRAGDAAITLYHTVGDRGFAQRIDVRRRYALLRMMVYSVNRPASWPGCSPDVNAVLQIAGRQLDALVHAPGAAGGERPIAQRDAPSPR